MTDRSPLGSSRFLLALVIAAVASVGAFARSSWGEEDADIARRDGATTFVRPAEARLRADVSYLADDLREGRGPGTRGLDDAAEYIAAAFRAAGLKPAPGAAGYFQPFTLPSQPQLQGTPRLEVAADQDRTFQAEPGTDFSPLGIGTAADLEGVPLVFAGYGITASDEQLKLDYDDYKDLDARDKAVLILRREPQQNDPESAFAGTRTTSYATFGHKYRNAMEQGAKAVLLVNDAAGPEGKADELLDFAAAGTSGGKIPFIMLSRAFADQLLSAAGAPSLAELERSIDEELQPASRPLEGLTLDAHYEIERHRIPVRNVIGVLEGAGPLAGETIVVGAHYDHLGRGGPGSLALGSREIHNGADDNASGTALILELARRLAARPDPLPRRVVFIGFSGEERGLLGSKHYVDHPLFPLEETVAMLNFDMVGRLDDDQAVTVYGTPTIEGMDALVESLAASQSLGAKLVRDTAMQFSASDHASFYFKDIPVLFFFTGTHEDYHRPSDDTERINFVGMVRIADLAEQVLLNLALRPERPEFQKLPPARPRGNLASASGRTSVYMGTRPSYGSEAKGVELDGVTEGSPAEKAGLKAGDVIIRFGGQPIAGVEDFMEGLVRHKPGDTVEVVVQRDGSETTLKVTLESREQN